MGMPQQPGPFSTATGDLQDDPTHIMVTPEPSGRGGLEDPAPQVTVLQIRQDRLPGGVGQFDEPSLKTPVGGRLTCGLELGVIQPRQLSQFSDQHGLGAPLVEELALEVNRQRGQFSVELLESGHGVGVEVDAGTLQFVDEVREVERILLVQGDLARCGTFP